VTKGGAYVERGYDIGTSVWGQLGERFSLVSARPRLASDARVRKIGDDIELVQLSTGRVVALDPGEDQVVKLMDGSRTVSEIVFQTMAQGGQIAIRPILELIDRVMRAQMFENFPPNMFRQLESYLSKQAVRIAREQREAKSPAAQANIGTAPPDWNPDVAAARLVGVEPSELTNFEQVPWRPMTPLLEERARLLRSVELFRAMDLSTIGALAEAAHEEAYPAAHNILNEGEAPDRFYVIKSGECNVTRVGDDGKTHRIAKLSTGDWFGEAGLLETAPRNANVRVGPSRPVQVLSFDTKTFEKFISPHIESFRGRQVLSRRRDKLATVSLFGALGADDIDRLAHSVREVRAPKGTVVFTQGDHGDLFYVIAEGAVGVVRDGVPVAKLTQGDFFGETALLFTGTRTATVITTEKSMLWAIEKAAFERLIRDHLLSRRDMMPTVMNRMSS
jgi:CRP-like cAMP-binding protein